MKKITVTCTHMGHQFAATLALTPCCELASGATGYEGRGSLWRDGVCLGYCEWDPEDFVPGCPDLLPDTEASEAAYSLLANLVRDELDPRRKSPLLS